MASSDLAHGVCSTLDDLGPAAVVFLRGGPGGATAVVVIDNVACGPAIGGVRMAPDVTVDEVARLARAMTFKNAGARLPHGGGKAGILADPTMPAAAKEATVRWFAQAIRDLHDYIPGPDMGTDERCMAWVHDEMGRAAGLPEALGGIPLDDLGATGFGLAVAAEAAAEAGVIELGGARVAIQGYGAVGHHAARFLADRGALIVSVSDSRGAVHDPAGLDVDALTAWKLGGHPVGEFPGGTAMARDDLVVTDCDILVPAARPDVVTEANVAAVRATLVLPGANLGVTAAAEAALHDRGVLCLPDWIVNAGGVICAAVEYAGGTAGPAFDRIAETVRANTAAVIERSVKEAMTPRAAAEAMTRERLDQAMALRRSFR